MATTAIPANEKVVSYIESLPDWSKNICTRLRHIILEADAPIVEEWKWAPHYACHGMVCGYGAFQKHVKFTFFNGSAMKDPKGLFNHCVDNEFSRSIKYVSEDEIEAATLTAYIQESVALNQKGFKREVKDKTVAVPPELTTALAANPKAQRFFDGLSYGYKKEYAEWVATAKRQETRQERIGKVVAYCAAERRLNDQYKK